MKTCNNDRRIIWYVDKEGGGGKTSFAKHFGMYRGAIVMTHCNIYHAATQLAEAQQKGNPINVVIINLPRSTEMPVNMYTGLEALKDGLVTSQKYIGKTMYFNSPHVVVFSNEEPKKYITYHVRKIVYNEEFKRNMWTAVEEKRENSNSR